MLQALAVPPTAVDAGFDAPADPIPTSPQLVRQAAACLVADNQLDEAFCLVDSAARQHPDSQELVSMLALISEARHDWAKASVYLERLVRLQGSTVTAETLSHWVRVLRCQGQVERAARLAGNALRMYPGHVLLESEHQTLNSILVAKAAKPGA
jgi:uncharacterized protein HemY